MSHSRRQNQAVSRRLQGSPAIQRMLSRSNIRATTSHTARDLGQNRRSAPRTRANLSLPPLSRAFTTPTSRRVFTNPTPNPALAVTPNQSSIIRSTAVTPGTSHQIRSLSASPTDRNNNLNFPLYLTDKIDVEDNMITIHRTIKFPVPERMKHMDKEAIASTFRRNDPHQSRTPYPTKSQSLLHTVLPLTDPSRMLRSTSGNMPCEPAEEITHRSASNFNAGLMDESSTSYDGGAYYRQRNRMRDYQTKYPLTRVLDFDTPNINTSGPGSVHGTSFGMTSNSGARTRPSFRGEKSSSTSVLSGSSTPRNAPSKSRSRIGATVSRSSTVDSQRNHSRTSNQSDSWSRGMHTLPSQPHSQSTVSGSRVRTSSRGKNKTSLSTPSPAIRRSYSCGPVATANTISPASRRASTASNMSRSGKASSSMQSPTMLRAHDRSGSVATANTISPASRRASPVSNQVSSLMDVSLNESLLSQRSTSTNRSLDLSTQASSSSNLSSNASTTSVPSMNVSMNSFDLTNKNSKNPVYNHEKHMRLDTKLDKTNAAINLNLMVKTHREQLNVELVELKLDDLTIWKKGSNNPKK